MKTFLRMMLVVFALFLGHMTAFAQRQISGTVNDPAGNPLVGVGVVVRGTTSGTVTDLNGSYSLSVPENATLLFSCIGYSDEERDILPGQNVYNVVLTESSELLSESVAVGYGSITKRSLSTAISTVKGDKIADLPTSTMAQALAGMSSGITLQQISGDPGRAPAIRIRGAGSINSGNDPLYVIDGYPTTDSQLFNNLNPSDIADIQIMKDAASSAIYGSKAGNGVIIVTTKQGSEGKAKVSFSTQIGISQPQNYVDVLNATDFLDMIIEARTNNGTISQFPDIVNLRSKGNYPDTDWQKEVFRNALNQRYNMSVTGGTSAIRYNVSAGIQDEDGILLNSYFKKYNINAGFEANLNDHVKLGVSFSPTFSLTRSQSPSGGNTEDVTGVVAEVLTGAPILPVYQPNGDYAQTSQYYAGKNGTPNYGLNNQWRNPVANLLENNNDTYSIRTMNNAYVEITPFKNLVLRSSLNFVTNSNRREYYQSAFLLGNAYTGNKSTPYLNVIDAYRSSGFGYNLYWSNTVTYKWSILDSHNFNAVIGYDYEYNSGFSVRQDDRTDADNPVAYNNTTITNVNGATLWNGSSSFSEYLFDAMFGRLIYDYRNKYILSGSVRRDRSSKFGPDNRAGVFYSVSGAWNITEEPFLRDLKWLSIAKLRASYGVTGNDQIGNNYAWLSSLSSNHNVIFGTIAAPTYYPSGYSNRMLGWEKNKQINLGFDIGLFERLNLTVDLYKRNSDIVMPANIPNFNGIAGSIYMNAGEVENKGIEVQLTGRPFVGDFRWETSLNWSLNKNKIVSLANNQTQLANQGAGTKWGNVIRNYVGRPMGDMYMLKVIGTFNTEEDLLNNARNGTQAVGDLMFEDYNGDKKIDSNDYQYVGNYQPDFTFGWNNTFAYKNFDLAVTIDGQQGGKVIFAAARAFTLNRYDDNVLAESGLGRWKSATNPGNGKSHKAGTNNLGSNIGPNTRYLYDASYLRIRNVALGYTIPRDLCRKVGMEGVRISANFQNVWTFDRYPGYSVESNFRGNSSTNNGVDFGSYPISRIMTIGVNINF
jgi:TonB-linked SusC/RagA family outer membrane protein